MKETAIQQSETKEAVIYCRVSSKSQLRGSGLDSQEHRCREYAKQRGYEVVAVFPDDVSGGGDFMKRKGMVALLNFLDENPFKNYVVVFDDLKRYARDVEFHLKLKREMEMRGAMRDCLNFRFEDTPESKFVETVLAAQGELEREQNRRQVLQKMKARVEQGYWVKKAPRG
jgi:site-specific DNA recombinase